MKRWRDRGVIEGKGESKWNRIGVHKRSGRERRGREGASTKRVARRRKKRERKDEEEAEKICGKWHRNCDLGSEEAGEA